MIGVTYYKNGTAKAQVATNMSWTLINTGCDSQKLLPSPRNMFCLDSSTGVISTTAVFGQIQPEGDSTFILDIVILDSGIQQMNASTKVVIRISKNCTAGNSVYTQLITKCPPGRDGVKVSTENEEQTYKHTLLVQKSRTRLIGLEIDRMFFISSKVKVFMGEILTFNITYSTNSSQKSFETKQRLLFDPASSRETVWKILFEKEEVTDIDRTPVVIRILNHDGVGLSSFSHSIRLIVVLEKNYCNQSECLSNYTLWKNSLLASKNRACLFDDNYVHARYLNCKVINKTPVIDSKTLSYVSISQLATNGQQVTKIYASDPEKSTLYYYVSEVKYYESITSKPQSAFSLPFGYTTCDLQQNLPFPRNMFCLNYITGVISTTTMFSKMKPEGDSIFVLEVVVLDSGDQQMNVSTQITIHISKNCTAGNSFYLRLIKNCPAGQDGVTLTGLFANMTDRHRLSVPKANTFLVGLEVDPGYFRRTPVNVGEVVTFNITYPTNSSQKTIIIKPRLLFNPVVSGQGTKWKIFFENREKTDKDFTRVMISISKQNGIGIIGFTYQFSLLGVLDKKYCDQSDCFSDYVGWRNALLASKNKVCLIGSNFVHERYQTCKGWLNLTQGAACISTANKVTCTCRGSGYPLPEVFWTKNMTGFLSRVANGSQYTVTIGRQIDGVYQCHVKNILGERTSSVRFSFWYYLSYVVKYSLSNNQHVTWRFIPHQAATNAPAVTVASHEKIKKSTQAGSSIFSVRASDKDNDQVLYSIIGVDYYVNSTADPKSAHNASWGMKTDLQQVNKCVTDSLLPFPRNLFCIGLRNGTVYTTQAFSKINIATGSKFLLHIIIYDNAVPQRNVTTVITVEVQRQCEAALSHYKFMQTKCNTTIESYEPDSVNTSSNASFSQHRFLINKGSVALAGLNISFAVFDAWNFVNGDFLTYNVTVVGSSSYITRMRLFHIPPAASAATTIRFPEVLKTRHSDTVVYLSISDKNGKFLTSSSAAVRLLGFPDADYCLNHSCVSTWENGTQILNSIGETGCVKEEAERYFFDSKYGNCAVSLPINIPPVSASEQYFNLRGDASPKMVVGQISAKDPDHTRLYFYIIGATYFMNETASPISVKDETLDEDRVIENTCQKAELMLYPLNLFCIDLKGKILTSAKFPMNRPTNGSTFVLSILIQDSGIPPKNVTVKATLRMRLDQNDCNLQDVAQLYNQMQKSCDSRAFASLMLWNRFSHTPMKIVVNGNLYLLSMKIDFNKLEKWTFRIGEKVEYTLNFTNNSHLIKLNYTLLFNPTKENTQTVILPSAYLLRSLDTVEVTIRPESGNYLQGMHNAVVLYTVPNEEYCRKVSCIEMEANRIRILKKAKLDDCVSPDTKYFYFKYGRCLGNAAPVFTKIKNVVITSPLAVDSVITSVKATDPDQSQVFYSIVWIHSKLLGKNATTPDYIKSDCSCHVRGVCSTPRNYLCISNTGDISISSAFKQEPGEVLSVMVMVSDSGNPKRYTYRLLTVTVFDPCGRTKDLYKRLNNTYCLRSLLALHMQISETKLSQTNALFYTHTSGMQVDKILYMVINFAKFTIPSGTARILISVKQRLPDGSFGRVINIGRLYNSTERFTQIPLDFYVTAGQMVEVAVIAQRLVPTLPPASTSVSSQTATPSEAMDLRISISPISSFRSSFFIESSESKYLPKKATTASTFMHSSVSQLSIESSESKYLPTKATTASIFMQASVSQLSIKSNESNYLPTKVTTASIFTQASVSQHTSKAKPSQSSSASQYMQLPNPINSISIEPSTSHHLTMILATTSISFKASVSLHSVSEMLLKTQSVSRNISLPVATGSNALPSAVGQYNSTTHSTPLLKQGLESSISTLAGYKSPIFVKASGLHPLSMVSDTTAADVTSVSLAVVNPSSASSQRPAISSFSTGFGGGLILTERPPRGVPMPLKIIDQGNSGGSTVQVSSLANVSLSLSYDSVKLYGFSFKSYCGKSHCVNSYIEWKNVTKEAKRNGHAECGKDPQSIQDFYEECLNPPKFVTHPQKHSVNLGYQLQLTCGFYNYTEVTFYWMKDGQKLHTPKTTPSFTNTRGLARKRRSLTDSNIRPVIDGVDINRISSQGNTTLKNLRLFLIEPDMQGFYSCAVEDKVGHVIESRRAFVRLKDVSTTKMALKLDMQFESYLLNETSPKYLEFKEKVIDAVNNTLNQRGLTGRKSFALKNIRNGSVLLDVYVYFIGLNNSARASLCSNLKNVPTSGGSGELKISELNIATLDCCDTSVTGEEKIKGVMIWPTTVADTNLTIPCPYKINDTTVKYAVRECESDFIRGPQWVEPNIDECPYKTKTTQQLEALSETKVNDSNAVQVSKQLADVVEDPERITNRLDVKFAADTIESLVEVQSKLKEVFNNILNATSNILSVNTSIVVRSQRNFNSSARLLSALQVLANNIPVQDNETVVVAKKNIAMGIKVINTKKTAGLLIQAASTTQPSVNNLTLTNSPSDVTTSKDMATIFLSGSLLDRAEKSGDITQRITTFIYDNEKLFLIRLEIDESRWNGTQISKKLNSKILSAAIKDTKLRNLKGEEQVRSTFSALDTDKGKTECVFWDFNGAACDNQTNTDCGYSPPQWLVLRIRTDGHGSWSSWGCWSNGRTGNQHRCRCNHLTNFAILLDVSGGTTVPPQAQLALSIITYIGCAISLAALVFTFLTFAIFRNLRKSRPPKILMHLCFALIALIVILLAGLEAKNKPQCQSVSVLIHYFVLVSFCWMAVEGFNLYLCFVKVMGSEVSKFLWKASVFAWGLPLVIVAISAGVTKLENYATKRDNGWLCMVKGIPFYAAYLAPILIVVTCNLIILALVLRSLLKKSSVTKDKQMDVATKVRITAACSVLMGVTWIVGLFAVEELTLTFQIVFCVFNSLQGFFIFVFYCARNKDVLREWKRCFGCRSEEYSSTSGAQRRGYNTNSKSYTNKMYTNQSEKRRTYLTDDSVPLSSFGGSRPASTASYPTYSTVISNSYSEPEKPLINLNNSSPAKEPEKSSTSTDLIKIELTRIADPYNPETPRPVSGEGYDDMKFFMKKDFSSQSIATIFTEETRDIGAFENQTLENEESVSGRRKDSDADSGISNEGKETAPGSEMSTAL